MSLRVKSKKIHILLVCLSGLFNSFLIGLMFYLLIAIMMYPYLMFFMGCVIIIVMIFLIMEFTENVITLLKRFGVLERKIKKDKISKREKLYNKLANLQQNLINTAINMINDVNLDDDNKDIMMIKDDMTLLSRQLNKDNIGENIDG